MSDLYPFQEEGVAWLQNQELEPLRATASYLADTMGLGKTVQAAVAAQGEAKSALVIAPASTLPNWHNLWEEWNGSTELFTVSYSKLVRNFARYQEKQYDFDLVILDEAHYVKNPRAKRTRAALTMARQAGRAYLLSGTPMPNDPTELYAPIKGLWPEILEELGIRTQKQWLNRFCKWFQTQYGPKVYGVRNASELRPYLSRIMLRRTVNDVALDLPPLRVNLHLLPNDGELDDALAEHDVDPTYLRSFMGREEASEDGSRSRVRRLLGTLKAPKIAATLAKELDDHEYHKVVVLAYHRDVLDLLRKSLEEYGVVGFDGSTPSGDRQDAIDRFTHDPSARVFIGQQTAAGVGINLQVASEIVLVEPDWTPAVNRQGIKRVHRIGSKDRVRARLFGVEGTMDADIMRTLANKIEMQEELKL